MIILRKMQRLAPKLLTTAKRLYSPFPASNNYDIIITGGGMVGTTLACALGKNSRLSGKKILLLEAGKTVNYANSDKYSNRVSAINPSTQQLMKEIGAWEHVTRYAPVLKLQVWDALSDAMITFNNDDFNKIVAYIVENDLLIAAVSKQLSAIDNVTVINDAKVKSYDLPLEKNGIVKVNLEDGSTFHCKLLLGCDGAKSKVRETMGVRYLSWNYDQMGVVATLKLTEIEENVVAWQRFLPTGPIALLPLNKEFSSLVWSTTIEHAKTLLSLPEDRFVDAVNDAIWKKYSRPAIADKAINFVDSWLKSLQRPTNAVRQLPPSITECVKGSRAGFPLGFGHATNYVTLGVALVGDAAHRVHPLAGQGVNLGFGDVSSINALLGEAVYSGSDVSDIGYLKSYETSRQRHNIPTMLAIDGLHKLYKTSFGPVVALRSLGLQITHALPPLKKAIIQQAAH